MRSVGVTNSVQVLMASCQLWIKFSTFTKAARIFNTTVEVKYQDFNTEYMSLTLFMTLNPLSVIM